MFFCDECKDKNKWPGFIARSYGRCEVCEAVRKCYDVPSKALPLRPVDPDIKTKASKINPQTGLPMPVTSVDGVPVATPASAPESYTVQVVIAQAVKKKGVMGGNIAEAVPVLSTSVVATSLEDAVRKAKGIMDVALHPST